ncbi:MAG: metallophosphoesterase [Actinomycetota bacterium]
MLRYATVALTCLLLLLFVAPADPAAQTDAQSGSPRIAAVGDLVCHRGPLEGPNRNIERYGECVYPLVSDLVVEGDYDAFLPLGDLQYLQGDLERFNRYYDPSYGRVKNITRPVPGNHEYYTREKGMWGAGYYSYFGPRSHPPHGYYSYNLGDWHLIALNSQLCKEKSWLPRLEYVRGLPGDGCRPGDPEFEWLKRDLARHPNDEYKCTLAYMHHPLFKWSYYDVRETDRVQRPLWRLLRAAGVDVVLAGHWHNYQRFEPLNTKGEVSDKGIVEFIVGTGGDFYNPLPEKGAGAYVAHQPKPEGLAAAAGQTHGILEMTLNPTGYDYEFITAEGQPEYEDAGSTDCR